VEIPDGATTIAVPGGQVTPGLIDANARVESADLIPPSRRPPSSEGPSLWPSEAPPGGPLEGPPEDDPPPGDPEDDAHEAPFVSGVRPGAVVAEQSSEVVPYIRVLDALDLRSRDLERLVRGGVTTVYVSPDASAVIGPRGAVVRAAGPVAKRVLVPAAAVKATIGTEPSFLGARNRTPYRTSVSLYARRPNSRMGLVWVFRKAFYDAARRRDGLAAYGADTASPEASAVLVDVLAGEVPLRIQARIQQDILTALRLSQELELEFVLEEATEAYLCLDELREAGVPVVFGPIYERPDGVRARSGEGSRSRYSTFRQLIEAGIPTALSAQDLREEDGLARQVMYALRFGVGFDDALRAVTLVPARLLGLDRQLGTVEPRKRADLVVWSGRPFAATSRVLLVLIDGKVVVDAR
jgi:imidazolonepropionase-like amidohydrolase